MGRPWNWRFELPEIVVAETDIILHHYPHPASLSALYPEHSKGYADMIAAWADRQLFANALGLAFGLMNCPRLPVAVRCSLQIDGRTLPERIEDETSPLCHDLRKHG